MPAESKSANKARLLLEKGLTFFHKGEYQEASQFLYEAIMEDAQSFEAMYNLACCYSMLGDTHNAIKYLHRAAQLAPQCVDWAKEDREFDPIRNENLFQEIVGAYSIDEEDRNPETREEPEAVAPPDLTEEEPAPTEEEAELNGEPAPVEEEAPPPEEEQYDETGEENWGGGYAPAPPVSEPSVQPSGPLPRLQGAKKKKPEPPPPQAPVHFPPCASCGGIIDIERRQRYNIFMILIALWLGIMLCIMMFVSLWGGWGFVLILGAFYLLLQTEEKWVCQNCGAVGRDCGEPPKKKK
ncbi:MAG: tetratricopeptide repeat protein [bacterium]|nr:tetratricopeptide repeat protein [bacterium]